MGKAERQEWYGVPHIGGKPSNEVKVAGLVDYISGNPTNGERSWSGGPHKLKRITAWHLPQ
ncbi:hypothetical protein [Paenibacillus albus]|uniref:Uncharacterized protein n=1 Tax=Paenibacillus albus TaxID=2495582 RepID=A0A3S9A2C9_9BACL|nr:hypothetical protein [Paenibacillus albus]AZN39846.1 hypothetical protein EJC50_09445 [Paenibacillus albus]